MRIEVKNQGQLDAAIEKWNADRTIEIICLDSGGRFLYLSGAVEVVATGSSTVHAYGSSTVHATDSSTVHAYGSSTVRATKHVGVTRHGDTSKVDGGVLIQIPALRTAADWLDFYGAKPKRGVVTLYKAVDADFKSGRGFAYVPGTTPTAPDWDGGKEECGGGLHFCARPILALRFFEAATRFVACPVRVKDIVVHCPATYPDKVKAPGLCAPCWEVDIDGNAIVVEAKAAS